MVVIKPYPCYLFSLLAVDIWTQCPRHFTKLFILYVSSDCNIHQHSITANLSTSRINSTSTFQWLNRLWSPHSIGLFASITTTSCHPLSPVIIAARSPTTLPHHMLVSDGNEHQVLCKNSKRTMLACKRQQRSLFTPNARKHYLSVLSYFLQTLVYMLWINNQGHVLRSVLLCKHIIRTSDRYFRPPLFLSRFSLFLSHSKDKDQYFLFHLFYIIKVVQV